jgi:hypothetical protein
MGTERVETFETLIEEMKALMEKPLPSSRLKFIENEMLSFELNLRRDKSPIIPPEANAIPPL